MKSSKGRNKGSRRHRIDQPGKTSQRNHFQGDFSAEERLAEKHFSGENEWSRIKKSKGADEEG
jgi:hypothetical protein